MWRVQWAAGLRPNYRRDPLFRVIRNVWTGRIISVWFGNIRIGRG